MFRAVIIGPFQDELAEGFGYTRTEALASAKDYLGSWNTALYNDGQCSVEYHREDNFANRLSGQKLEQLDIPDDYAASRKYRF